MRTMKYTPQMVRARAVAAEAAVDPSVVDPDAVDRENVFAKTYEKVGELEDNGMFRDEHHVSPHSKKKST
ncbi:MAG: hypothetical protein IZT75_07790 [Pseudoramibacter alactolyticus]|nr:hypothetical protein [Pseudoramibacter alactolyticus]